MNACIFCAIHDAGGIMKGNYENWMPQGLINSLKYTALTSGAAFAGICVYIFARKANGQQYLPWLSILCMIFLLLAIGLFILSMKFKKMRKLFDFNNEESLSWKIINYTANALELKPGARVLDVGCGSGALAVTVAMKNPECQVLGVDKWGASYKSFSKDLCEKNAAAEGLENVSFQPDNAVSLSLPDESFDAVTSNYVYHNIPGNRQKYLLETFRVLKKGGQFAIHDLFTKSKYGDLKAFRQKLLDMGFERVEFVDTTTGNPMPQALARKTMLTGSSLLTGKK